MPIIFGVELGAPDLLTFLHLLEDCKGQTGGAKAACRQNGLACVAGSAASTAEASAAGAPAVTEASTAEDNSHPREMEGASGDQEEQLLPPGTWMEVQASLFTHMAFSCLPELSSPGSSLPWVQGSSSVVAAASRRVN